MADGAYLKTNFNSGQLDTAVMGRSDLDKVQGGALIMRNMMPLPGGAITRRPGLRNAGSLRFDAYATRTGQYAGEFVSGGTNGVPALVLSGTAPNSVDLSGTGWAALRTWYFSPSDAVSFGVSIVSDVAGPNTGYAFIIHPVDTQGDASNPALIAPTGGFYYWTPAFPASCQPDDIQMDFLADTAVFTHQSGPPVRIRYTGQASFAGKPWTFPVFSAGSLRDLYIANNLTGTPPMEPFVPESARSNKPIRIDPASEWIVGNVDVPLAYNPAVGARIDITLEGVAYLATVDTTTTAVVGGTTVRRLQLVFNNRSVSATANDARLFLATTTYDDTTIDDNLNQLRSDKVIFGSHLIGAHIRWQDRYPDVRRPDLFLPKVSGAPAIRWARIKEYVGLRTQPKAYIIRDSATNAGITDTQLARKFFLGSSYRIARNGQTNGVISLQVGAPGALSNPTWTDAAKYNQLGDQFTWTNAARVEPPLPAGDIRIEDITTPVLMDTVNVDDILTEGSNLIVIPSGVAQWSSEYSVRRTAHCYVDANDPRWAIGSYHMARFGSRWVAFRLNTDLGVDANGSRKWEVFLLNALPRETSLGAEATDAGSTSEYVSSLWHQGDYPAAVSFFEQRLFFAGSPRYPETVWASALGNFGDFRAQEPDGKVLASTGISVSMAGSRVSRIRWLITGGSLLIGTDNSEWSLGSADNSRALTAENIRLRQESVYGSSGTPLRVGNTTLFLSAGGSQIIEYGFSNRSESYEGRDLLLLARHRLLSGGRVTIRRLAYSNDGIPLLAALLSDGRFATCLYEPGNALLAWSEHNHAIPECFLTDLATYTRPASGGERQMLMFLGRGTLGFGSRMEAVLLHLPPPNLFNEEPGVCFPHLDGYVLPASATSPRQVPLVGTASGVSAFDTAVQAVVRPAITDTLRSAAGSAADTSNCFHLVSPACVLVTVQGGMSTAVASSPADDGSTRNNGTGVTRYQHVTYRVSGGADSTMALTRMHAANGGSDYGPGATAYVTAGYPISSFCVLFPVATEAGTKRGGFERNLRIVRVALLMIASGFVRLKQVPLSGLGMFYSRGGAQHSVDYEPVIAGPDTYLPGDSSGWWFTGWLELPFSGAASANNLIEFRSSEASVDNTSRSLPYPLTVAAVRVDTM